MKKVIILLVFWCVIMPANAYNYYGSSYSYNYYSLSSPTSIIFNPAHAINPINIYHPMLYGNRNYYHKKTRGKDKQNYNCIGNWFLRFCTNK